MSSYTSHNLSSKIDAKCHRMNMVGIGISAGVAIEY